MSPELVSKLPCVGCSASPTVGHAYGGTQDTVGRICRSCADEFCDRDIACVFDEGSPRVVNWPIVGMS